MGQDYFGDPATGQASGVNDIPAAPPSWDGKLPNYLSALTTSFVQGTSIGYNDTCPGFVPGNPNSCTSYMVTPSNASTFSGAPSETNPSMWRCVPGSAFFFPYECNAGDLMKRFPLRF